MPNSGTNCRYCSRLRRGEGEFAGYVRCTTDSVVRDWQAEDRPGQPVLKPAPGKGLPYFWVRVDAAVFESKERCHDYSERADAARVNPLGAPGVIGRPIKGATQPIPAIFLGSDSPLARPPAQAKPVALVVPPPPPEPKRMAVSALSPVPSEWLAKSAPPPEPEPEEDEPEEVAEKAPPPAPPPPPPPPPEPELPEEPPVPEPEPEPPAPVEPEPEVVKAEVARGGRKGMVLFKPTPKPLPDLGPLWFACLQCGKPLQWAGRARKPCFCQNTPCKFQYGQGRKAGTISPEPPPPKPPKEPKPKKVRVPKPKPWPRWAKLAQAAGWTPPPGWAP